MKRKHKSYSRPKRPFDKTRIIEEAGITTEFGLKNKKEIWKAEAKIKSIRGKAKKLISAAPEEQQALFDRLNKIGLKIESISDILALTKNDYLARRLQTIIVAKKLASTAKEARQMIIHKKILVNGDAVDSPSYIVSTEMEDKISVKPKKEKKVEEIVEAEESETVDSVEETKNE